MMLRIASQEAEEEDGLWNMDELWWCGGWWVGG